MLLTGEREVKLEEKENPSWILRFFPFPLTSLLSPHYQLLSGPRLTYVLQPWPHMPEATE